MRFNYKDRCRVKTALLLKAARHRRSFQTQQTKILETRGTEQDGEVTPGFFGFGL